MRCRSVVGIWPETPPSHRITAIAAVDQPPTLFTGADDGSILWWSISGDGFNKEVTPVAILCGHTSSVVGLGICYPLLASLDVTTDHPSDDEASNLAFSHSSALISACIEGVLCVWSRGSRHCRRRRKLPPWAGSPCALQGLPSDPRFVCIASSIREGHYISEHNYTDAAEDGDRGHNDKDSIHKRHPKCSIVIVDSCTLTITQTVFHGNLSIGPLKFMDIVSTKCDHETKKHSILLVDALGKLQQISVLNDSNHGIEVKSELCEISPYAHNRFWDDGLHEDGHVLSITSTGKVIGLVYKTHCTFMLVDSEVEIGVISFENDLLHLPSGLMKLHAAGGVFLHVEDHNTSTTIMENHAEFDSLVFIVWNTRGFAVVYRLSYHDQTLKSEIVCTIPAACHDNEMLVSTNFIQLNKYLFRTDSVCFDSKEPCSWNPHITIWSLPILLYDSKDGENQCKMLGEGDIFSAWTFSSMSSQIIEGLDPVASGYLPDTLKTALGTENNGYVEDQTVARDGLKYAMSGNGSVTSSMVISHYSLIPYAVVYGHHNGDIELAQLEGVLLEPLMDNVHPHEMMYHEPKQKFSGHTGAVLCLAAHSMMSVSDELNYSDVLISGSMDSTVRIWDLKTGNPVMVMHHHVAPVRQILLPPFPVDRPWNDCFLSVGEDGCVALTSLLTLRVERMFPGHPDYPSRVVWDGSRGYLACLSQSHSSSSGAKEALFIWDIKTGSRERTLHGSASHSMFENFCKGVSISDLNTSASSLHAPLMDSGGSPQSYLKEDKIGSDFPSRVNQQHGIMPQRSAMSDSPSSNPGMAFQHEKLAIRCSCPSSGIAILSFDLASLMSCGTMGNCSAKEQKSSAIEKPILVERTKSDLPMISESLSAASVLEQHEPDKDIALSVLRFSLAYLHMWDVHLKLDNLLLHDMMLWKPGAFKLAPGLQGDRGSVTLALPGFSSSFEFWRSSSEFTAMRSLTMVSLAQRMVGLSDFCSLASSALSAFYTRNLAEQFPHIKPPSLQLLVSFWQHEDEHIRMAARTLFHCSAARAIPSPLCCPKTICQAQNMNLNSIQVKDMNLDKANSCLDAEVLSNNHPSYENKDLEILKWMESYEMQDWISCVGGTSQDAMASHIIIASALAIWYSSLVKDSLATLAVQPLIKLVMAMSEKYSSTAAELLAEGMNTTWKSCIQSEIPRLIRDLFFQIECVSGASVPSSSALRPTIPPKIRETLVGLLLPSLALADILEFLSVIEGLIWSTASDSPVHLISVKILIRVIRGSPRSLAQYLDKVINFILLTLDPSNSVMRRTCFQSSITALKEAAHAFPMVALNESVTRLAVGDAIAETNGATVHVYDVQSASKFKVLDASGPPGLPNLLQGVPGTITTAISALAFSPDGEGVVGFSENGLIIRWWSLGTVWWEKLSRSFVPVQCTKLIFVPPWEGFSPNSSRISVMANIAGNNGKSSSQDHRRGSSDVEYLHSLILNLDLSYRLEWAGKRVVYLSRQGNMLGSFQL